MIPEKDIQLLHSTKIDWPDEFQFVYISANPMGSKVISVA